MIRPADASFGAAIVSAPAVLAALDGVEWNLLGSVRSFVGHEVLGDRARRLVDRIAEATRADQFAIDLVPVLDTLRPEAVALATEATRLGRVAPPPPPSGPPVEVPGTGANGAGRQDGRSAEPPAPPGERSGRSFRVATAQDLAGALRELTAAAHENLRAGRAVELTWRPVAATGDDTSNGPGAADGTADADPISIAALLLAAGSDEVTATTAELGDSAQATRYTEFVLHRLCHDDAPTAVHRAVSRILRDPHVRAGPIRHWAPMQAYGTFTTDHSATDASTDGER